MDSIHSSKPLLGPGVGRFGKGRRESDVGTADRGLVGRSARASQAAKRLAARHLELKTY